MIERGEEQQWVRRGGGDRSHAPERGKTDPLPRYLRGCHGNQQRENRQEPDDQREDDMDDQALGEKVQRPKAESLNTRNARNRDQHRHYARQSQRSNRKRGPGSQLLRGHAGFCHAGGPGNKAARRGGAG